MKQLLLALSLLVGFTVSTHALEVGNEAPCVPLPHINIDDSEVTQCIRKPYEQLKVLEFFSVFCGACHRNLPTFSSLHQEFANEEVTFRLVILDRKKHEEDIRNYVEQHRSLINFQVALDMEREATKAYGVEVTPTLFVLDQDNKIIHRHRGTLGENDVNFLRTLLNSKLNQ